MPRTVSNALTPLQVKNAKAGRHADGQGLYLLVKNTGARSWVYRYMLNGKARDLGLSRCSEAISLMAKTGGSELTLAQARDVASVYRMKVKAGIDPLEEREEAARQAIEAVQAAKAATVTFRTSASAYLAGKEGSWRNAKHRQQWHNTLATYVYPVIGDMEVAQVDTKHVLEIIEPIWRTKQETANRVRGRIEAVLDAARVRGYRTGDNPARWRGHLAQILPARGQLSRGHHEALHYAQIGSFMAKLRERDGMAALALEFTILTAARTNEALGARWAEIDFERAVWTIPAVRMKAGKEHRVPLSTGALDVLRRTKALGGEWVFTGQRGGQLSGMAMAMLLRRMGYEVTVHGFRSAFRDWAAETTAYPHDVCEAALAHTVGSKVVAAYLRGDLFEKRRRLMDDWAMYSNRAEGCIDEAIPLRMRSA
jgi:integrase